MNQANKGNIKKGTKVVVKGYLCVPDGSVREVKEHETGELYIECGSGKHFIETELEDNGNYSGLWLP